MSLASSPPRRVLATLAVAALLATLMGQPGGAVAGGTSPEVEAARAAVAAAKAAVQDALVAKQSAEAHRDDVLAKLDVRTAARDKWDRRLSDAASALRHARKQVTRTRVRLRAAHTPAERKAIRAKLRGLRAEARDRKATVLAARTRVKETHAGVDRLTGVLATAESNVAATRAAVKAARAQLAAANQHLADLLAEASGEVMTAVANIPNRIGAAKFKSSVGSLVASRPDFLVLNEISGRSVAAIKAAAPGYGVYRGGAKLTEPGAGGQSINNAVLWRTDSYQVVAQGRIQVVNDDRGYHNKKKFLWDRYATWVTLRNVVDGQVTSVISTHMPTNPAKFPRQWGNPPLTRVQMYAQGMDRLVALARDLARKGRVLLGGDMNSHPNQGAWTAAKKMAAAGYGFTKDTGVMYLFHSLAATVQSSRQLKISSDHPALVTTVQY